MRGGRGERRIDAIFISNMRIHIPVKEITKVHLAAASGFFSETYIARISDTAAAIITLYVITIYNG